MRRTVGYHLVKSGYGLWLPGDERGHWSAAWDQRIGFVEPHTLHPGDPIGQRMAMERMNHPPTRLTAAMMDAVAEAVGRCAGESPWNIAAASIEATHMHLVITYSGLDVKRTEKWVAQQTTKAVHRLTEHAGPVWCEGWWTGYVFDRRHWRTARAYIERHNERRGVDRRPYAFSSV